MVTINFPASLNSIVRPFPFNGMLVYSPVPLLKTQGLILNSYEILALFNLSLVGTLFIQNIDQGASFGEVQSGFSILNPCWCWKLSLLGIFNVVFACAGPPIAYVGPPVKSAMWLLPAGAVKSGTIAPILYCEVIYIAYCSGCPGGKLPTVGMVIKLVFCCCLKLGLPVFTGKI